MRRKAPSFRAGDIRRVCQLQSTSNTVDEKLDKIMKQIQIIKAYIVSRDTAQVLVSREMMKE